MLPRLILALVLLLGHAPGATPPLTVAAAADLGPALRDIASAFEQRTGTKLSLVLGSSGNLATQIENGAPYDVFLSADTGYPRRLEQEGLTTGSLYTYAVGKLVLWVPQGSSINLQNLKFDALLASSVRKVAIANPQHAPYGRAAVAALRSAQLYDRVQDKLVLGENVSQAAQFVLSGNAQVGLVPLALALSMNGAYWEIPSASYPPIEQGAVIVKNTKAAAAAQQFLDFLKSPDAAAILRRYGFQLPEAK